MYPIASRSTVNCVPQFGFATRSYQHWEDVEIRVHVPMISKATELKSKIDDLIYYVYEESDDYAIQDVKLRPQIIYSYVSLRVSNSVEFDRIQDIIVQGIRDAKYLIWVAVAWFSNDVLYQELLNKKRDGLNIRVIVSDEYLNRALLPKIQKNFEGVVVPHTGRWGGQIECMISFVLWTWTILCMDHTIGQRQQTIMAKPWLLQLTGN